MTAFGVSDLPWSIRACSHGADGSAMLDRDGRGWRPLDAGTIMGQLWGHYQMRPSQLSNGHRDLRPHWSAQTTRGADAHFGPPAMRTRATA